LFVADAIAVNRYERDLPKAADSATQGNLTRKMKQAQLDLESQRARLTIIRLRHNISEEPERGRYP